MRPQLLSPTEIQDQLAGLNSWEQKDNALSKQFTFSNFPHAFGFMTKVAFAAEKLNHHPAWENTYNKVLIRLSTHDAGGITELDFTLARQVDKIAEHGL